MQRHAERLDPSDTMLPGAAALAAFQSGAAAIGRGEARAAVAHFEAALTACPDWFDAQNNLGVALRRSGALARAIATLEDLCARHPARAEAWVNLARCRVDQGALVQAEVLFARAATTAPALAEAQLGRAECLHALGRTAEAEACLMGALAAAPDHVKAWIAWGQLQRRARRYRMAAACMERALALQPEALEALCALGTACTALGQHAAAALAFQRALALAPGHVEALIGKAQNAIAEGALDLAREPLEQALVAAPHHVDAHLAAARLAFLAGDYALAWREFEWRWQLPGAGKPHFPVPEWEGEALSGRHLFLWAEQGLGDTLQFLRYAQVARARGARIELSIPPPLVTLVRRSLPGVPVHSGPPAAAARPDFHLPLASLPLRLGLAAPLAVDGPYLDAGVPGTRRAGPPRRIGLIWRGNPAHSNDHQRSLPPEALAPLLALEHISWHSLQVDAGDQEALSRLPAAAGVMARGAELASFDDTARVLMELDLLISVDTSVAHLAGALDVPVWILLPFAPDWRWGRRATRTPWYGSARLFRQSAPGDWRGPIEQIRQRLADPEA